MENNGNLATKAMLVSLSISMWRCRRRDKRVTKETADRYGTVVKAGNYNKNLLPLEDENSYQAIVAAAAAAHFHEQTLPWLDEGTRICCSVNYLHLAEIMRRDRAAFERAVAEFKTDLPTLVKKAEAILGPKLFNAEEYPSAEDADSRFSFSLGVFPLPAAEDFRVDLAQDDVASIREQIERDVRESVEAAMGDVWRRLHEVVSHFREQVKGKVVKKAMLANLRELCEVLPRLNLAGDPRLEEMRRRVMSQLGAYEAEDLKKKHKGARRRAAQEAERIQRDLAAFMGT